MADTFSLQRVLETFRSSLSENKEVYIKYYISGWKELVRWVHVLLLFHFMALYGYFEKGCSRNIKEFLFYTLYYISRPVKFTEININL